MLKKFLTFLFLITTPALAQAANPGDYLVENVVVNVNAKSPSDAKNLAVKTARRDGFIILLTRLELKVRLADQVSDDEISDMVRSEQVDNEKIAGNSYSASYNIMFDKKFVDHILAQKNVDKIAKSDEESYLLIPVKLLKRKVILWEENNDWKKAIEKNLSQSEKKFTVPTSNVENIAFLNRDNVLTANYQAIEPMLNRYNANGAYLIFFAFDESENKVRIEVSYINKLQNRQTKLSFINVDHLNYQTLLDKVANKTIKYLSEAPNVSNANPSLVNIAIPISSFGNWMQIKTRIENSNLINQLSIKAISKDYAILTVNYVDARVDVVQGFANAGFSLEKKSENFYVLH